MISRDLRYVDGDGNVRLTPAIARDLVVPDPVRMAEVYGLAPAHSDEEVAR